jgi:hypothetical protein
MLADRNLLLDVTLSDRERLPADSRHVSTSRHDHGTPSYRGFRAGAAALLLVIGLVHLHLWFTGYRNLPTIGPLFLVAVVSAALLAIVVSARINPVIALAAASFAAGTLTANVLSLLLPDGLFRFKEVGVSYSGGFAIGSEIGVVMLLSIWACVRFRHAHRRMAPELTTIQAGATTHTLATSPDRGVESRDRTA